MKLNLKLKHWQGNNNNTNNTNNYVNTTNTKRKATTNRKPKKIG